MSAICGEVSPARVVIPTRGDVAEGQSEGGWSRSAERVHRDGSTATIVERHIAIRNLAPTIQ